MKNSLSMLAFMFLSQLLFASVPLRWSVETSKANPIVFDEFAGATYDFEAALTSYAKPLPVVGEPQFFFQTNGMGSTFWVMPAAATSNILKATWKPAYDVGAKSYNCFIGVTGSVYNAAFTLRLRHSPGAAPNVLPLPVPTIDCSGVEFLNAGAAPWILMPSPSVTPGYMLAKSTNGVEWVEPGISTNVVNDIIREAVETNWLYTVERSKEKIDMPLDAEIAPGLVLAKATNGVEWVVGGGGGSLGVIAYITDVSNKHYRVIAQKNPMGQIVAAVEQVESTPTMKTVEAEEARAYAAEYGINLRLTNEVARSVLADEDLNEKISSISALGRFISTWNCVSGRPGTEPKTATIEYKGGDYYLVTSVSTNETVNLIPSGSVYTNGTSSTTVAPDKVNFNDIYRFSDDGQWIHQSMEGIQTTFGQIAGYPTNNVRLAQALQEARMPAETVTNIAHAVATNLVTDGYLATPSVTNGLRRILDMNAYSYVPGSWTKTNTEATVTIAGVEIPSYTSLSWDGSKWTCYDSAAAKTVDMLGTLTDPIAYALGFPNGEITERQKIIEIYSRLATTNDLTIAFKDLDARLIAETNRAKTAEAVIADDLTAETNRAQVAEADLDARLIAETNRAQTAEAVIADDLTAETNRAQVAEAYLDARLVAETNRAQTAEAVIADDLTTETNRAQVAEADLDSRIIAETNRAQTAEAAIADDLTAETNRAQVAEADLDARIIAETNRAQTAEAFISDDLTAETTRAQASESALDSKIIAETNRAQVAEAALDTRITAETNRAQTAEASISVSVVAETNRAQVAEASIRTDLAAEVTRSTNAESDLGDRIDAEDARAQAAEDALDAKIIAETNRSQVAEAALDTRITSETTRATSAEATLDSAISAERNRAQGIENGLRTDLTAETTRATSAESALDVRIVSETNRSQQADITLSGQIVGEISRAQSEESIIRGELLTEKLRAQAAEGAVENLVVAESNRASTAELALSGSITAETVRATGAESSLQTLITIVNNQLTNRITKSESALIAETNRSIQADAALDLRIDGKQDALPAFVEGRYLHVTNGLLDWASVEAGGLTNVSWGMITGTLSNQADLNTALTNLNAKKQDKLPPAIKDYYLHANYSTGTLEWKGVTSGGSAEWGKIGGDLTNQLDLVEVVTNLAISATNYTDRATNEVVNLMTNKQDKLPVVVNDKFLHANKTTGALEWTTALPTSSASDNGKFLAANNGSSKWSYVGAITNGTSGTYNGSFIDANRNARQFLPFYTDWSPDHDIEFVIGRDLSRYDTIRYTNDTWICNKYTGDGSTWTLVGTVDMLGGENGNPDATSLQFPSTSGLTTMRTMSSQMKNTKVLVTEDLATKQDRLPSRIKDGFLHANANDRSYEWVTIAKPSFITNETDRSWIDSHAEAGFPTGSIGWVPNEVLIDSLTKYVVEETFNESFGSWYCRMFNKNPVTGNWDYSMSFPMEGDNTNPNATTLNFPGGETTRKLRAIVKTKLVTTNEITKVTLNGTDKCGNTASFYAPETAGTSGQILVSGGSGTPTWMTINFSDYLLRAGGTMTGTLNMNGNASISADGAVTAKSGTFNNSLSSGGSAIVANYVQGYGFKNSNTYLCRTVDNSYLSLRGGTDDQGCKIDLMGDESTEAGVVKIDAKINGSGKRMTLKSTGEATWNGTFNPTQGLKLNPTSGGGNGIDCANNDGLLNISAGTDSPKIYMRGGAKSGSPGVIDIIAQHTSASKTLTLNPNGTFTWGGKNVAVAESDTAASWTTDGVMKYRKYNGVVYFNLFGYAVVTPGTNVTIGNLPAAYRPAVQLDFVARTTSSGATILVIIGVNGDVTVYNGGSTASVKYYGYISYPSASN